VRRTLALTALGGLVACASVLGIRPPDHRPFEHRAHVLRGIHCLDCHRGVAGAGDTGPLHLPSDRDCVRCHREPHDARACNGCHGLEENRQGAKMARAHLVFSHAGHVGAARGDCVRCHEGVRRDAQALRPTMASCFSCHEHREEFATRDCDACHVDLETEGTMPASHLVHEGDFVRRHGLLAAAESDLCGTCHAESFCASCHGVTTAVLPQRLAFDDPFAPGLHRAGFRARHAEEARASPGLCTSCHAVETCEGCHAAQGLGAPRAGLGSPHPPGWLGPPGAENRHGREARRDPSQCAACHAGAGESLCVGCHRVGGIGGNPHPPGWRSSLRPGLDAACRPCHERAP
jgi:hypothetical protein